MSGDKPDLERMTWDIGFVTPEDVLDLIRLARAARRCHPDTFVSTPDEVAEYIEAASAFIDSGEAKA